MAGNDTVSEEQKQIANANLIDAARNDERAKIDLCLRKGADIDARSSNRNRTALMLAVGYGNADETAFILGKRPNLFLKDSESKTVFDICGEISDGAARRKINKMLLEAMPDAEAAPPTSAEKPADETVTGSDITILKPIELTPRRKPGGGLKL